MFRRLWLWVCAFLFACPSAVLGGGPTLRLQGTNQYFVTLDEADDATALKPPGQSWMLKGRQGFTNRRTIIDRGRQRLTFVDAPTGLGVRIPLVISFQEYYTARSRADFRRLWGQSLQQYLTRAASSQEKKGLLSLDLPVELPGIFGGGTPNFSITGNQHIELSGRSEWTDGQVRTATNRVSKFPALQMKQQQQFTVTGTIGEKVSVIIKQDSQAFSDLDNRISLRYEDKTEDGRDGNGIIKRFEAGNVTLSLENAEFTGYTDQHSGLFGLKMESKVGALGLTTILSQEKGEGQSSTFQAGSQASTNQIRDIDYRRRAYFFVDPTYRANYSTRNPSGIHYAAPDSIEVIRVFVADFGSRTDRSNIRKAAAYWQPPKFFLGPQRTQLDPPDSAEIERGDFRELQVTEFFVDRNLGYIALANPLQPSDILAVYSIVRNRQTGQRFEYGDIPSLNDESIEARLRLLKPRNETPPSGAAVNDPDQWGTWQYEWRNVYFLGKTDLNPQGFDLKIYRKSPGGVDQDVDETGTPYIQLLGLDRRGVEPGSPPDRLADVDYELINFQRGELIMPDLYPFAPGLLLDQNGKVVLAFSTQSVLQDQTPGLYTQRTVDINANLANSNKYYMTVQYKDRQAQYSLGRSNIIEGSEVVRLNGRKLNPNTDYIMLYEVGQIRFINEEALNPNANVTVDYQFAPFFKPASNTLMGLQGKYEINDKSWVRGTLLYRSEKTLDQKARIGRETGRSMLWDMDTRLSFKPERMTAVVNALPFVSVQAPSSLNISAELAQSIPNPNTKGDAFIDDFEGSKEETDLGVRRVGWVPASPPAGTHHLTRGRLDWYNPWEQVAVREIYPNREVIAQDSRQHVLTLEFDPARPDLRWGGTLDSTFITAWSQDDAQTRRFRWGGIMRPLSGASIDQTRSKFIEIWVNGDRGDLHIDLGSISEDVNENTQFDTEDSIRVGLRNNQLDEGEDLGLDGVRNTQEVGFNPVTRQPVPYDPATNPDPHGDDWAFDPSPASQGRYEDIEYDRMNGMENNVNDPDRGRRPDTEDINGSGFMDNKNDYVQYALTLSPDHPDTEFVAGGDRNPANWGKSTSWRLYRIPLATDVLNAAFKGKTGNPSFALIEMARLWITGVDSPVKVRIASIEIVGNQWQVDAKSAIVDTLGRPIPNADLIRDRETLNAAVKNTFDNPGDYVSPPGAIVEYDRVTRVQHREQSLVLSYENLQPQHTGQAFQTFYTDQDYTLYNDLRLFVHGSSNFTGDQTPEFFIRFGSSASDYYEYRTPLAAGWDPQNQIQVVFNDLTLLKSDTQAIRTRGGSVDTTFTIRLTDGQEHRVVVRAGTASGFKQAIVDLGNGREYRIQGSPSLSKVRQFLIGVSNPYDHPLDRGEIWLDELRVGNVRRDKGMAGRLSVDAAFSDFMTMRGTVRRTDSHYRQIGKPEAGSTTTLMDFNGVLNADKFFPKEWGLSIPINAAWQRNTLLPRLQVGSDIVLLRASQRQEQRTENARRQASASFSKRTRSPHLLTAWTIDRFRVNYAASINTNRSVTREDTTSTYNGAFNYDLTPRTPKALNLFKWISWKSLPKFFSEMKFSPAPSQLVFDTRIDRTFQAGVDRFHGRGRTSRFTRNLSQTAQAKMTPLTGASVDYQLSMTNDMRADSTISFKRLRFGRNIDYTQTFGIDYRPELVSWLRPGYSFTSNYRENRNPELRTIGTSPDERTINMSNKRTVRSNLNLERMLTSAFGRPEKGKKDQQSGFGGKAWQGMMTFVGILSPVDFTYSQDIAQNRFGLRSRPSLRFQLGFSDDPGVTAPPSSSTAGTQGVSIQRDRQTSSNSLSLSTGLKLTSSLEFTTRPRWNTSTTRSASTTTETESRNWPDVSARWSPSFSKLPKLQNVLRRLDLTSGYSRKVDLTTNTNLAGSTLPSGRGMAGNPENRSVSRNYTPLIEATTNWTIGLTMKVKFDATTTDQRNGLSGTDTRQQNRTLTISLDHQVKPGFILPIGRKKKRLEGSLRMQAQMVKGSTLSLLSRDHKNYQPSNGQQQLSFKVNSNYDFSRRVRGGLNIEWTNTENSVTHEKRRIRQGGFTIEFEFN